MMKLGILGAGKIAIHMADTVAGMKDVEAYAVAARNEERARAFAREHGFTRAYGSYEEMLADPQVDLVYIATPHSHHYMHAKMCLEAGKNVLCEKSFTVNADQARKLFALAKEKNLLIKILLLILLSAVLANFADVFESGQIGDICFYIVYLLLFILLMDSFSSITRSVQQTITWMAEFMRGLAPAYFLTISIAAGSSTAAVFYEGVLILTWLIQEVILNLLFPGACLYVLISLINNLSKEEMLGKMAELLDTAVSWGLKTLLGMVVGLQVVRGLIAPVMDTLKRSALGKAAGALPGVGNAVNMVTELVLTSAVLVRNCLGVVILFAFVAAGAGPVIHYGILSLLYRFLAAIAQPVSEKRIVDSLATMGEGCALLLRILFTAEILCILDFVILMTGIGGSG